MRNSSDEKHDTCNAGTSDCLYPVVLLCCGGIALSILTFYVIRRTSQEAIEEAFKLAAQERVTAVENRLGDGRLLLEAVGAFFAGSEHVTREEFAVYVRPFLEHFGCVQAVEWIPRVPDTQRRAFEQAARTDGLADFGIRERQLKGQLGRAADRGEYFPVHYVEPYKGNESALGFDLASNLARVEALNLSRDTGQTVATGRIKLVQESANQYGFLVFEPVFREGASVDSPEERREHLQGFVLGVFRVGDLMTHALAPLQADGIHIKVKDQSAAIGEEFLYCHRSRICQHPPVAGECRNYGAGTSLRYSDLVEVGRRKWQVICTPTDEFLAVRQTHKAEIALIVGIGTTLLLSVCIGLLIRYVDRLEKHAEAERRNRQLAMIAEQAGEGIAAADLEGSLQFVNRAWAQMHGYEDAGELVGQHLRVFHTAEQLEKEVCAFNEVVHRDGQYTAKVGHVRKDGTTFPAEMTTTVFRNESGKAVGYIGFATDITEREKAEESLKQTRDDLRDTNQQLEVSP